MMSRHDGVGLGVGVLVEPPEPPDPPGDGQCCSSGRHGSGRFGSCSGSCGRGSVGVVGAAIVVGLAMPPGRSSPPTSIVCTFWRRKKLFGASACEVASAISYSRLRPDCAGELCSCETAAAGGAAGED